MMPDMNGIELWTELQKVAPDQAGRLAFVTGGVFHNDTRRELERAQRPQLTKPLDPERLRSVIDGLVVREAPGG
jgi:CheY-like chemotaxis protein